jgi:hypothetical protein
MGSIEWRPTVLLARSLPRANTKLASAATEAPNALGSASNNLMVENTDFEAAAPPRKRVRFATISEREVRSCGI